MILSGRRWLAAATVYPVVFLAVSLMGCADRLLLHPTRGSIAPPVGVRDTIEYSGGTLDVVRFKTAVGPARARVIAFTGNGGRAEFELVAAAELFEDEPVDIVAVNPPGYGRSSGDARLAALLPAAVSVYESLMAEQPALPILVYGNSMGGTVALGLAASRPVAGLVLRNPPPLRDLVLKRHGWWNLWLLALPVAYAVPAELDAKRNAAAITVPTLFLQAARDEIVPVSYQAAIFERLTGPATLIEYEGGHNDPLDSDAVAAARRVIAGFLP